MSFFILSLASNQDSFLTLKTIVSGDVSPILNSNSQSVFKVSKLPKLEVIDNMKNVTVLQLLSVYELQGCCRREKGLEGQGKQRNHLSLTGKRPLGSPKHRWEDNIRMDLKEIGINTRNWVDSAQNREYWGVLVIMTLNPQVP